MLGLEVYLNRRRLYSASLKDDGRLNANVWLVSTPDFSASIQMAGTEGEDGSATAFDWPSSDLAVGDEVTIRVIDVNESDPAENVRRVTKADQVSLLQSLLDAAKNPPET